MGVGHPPEKFGIDSGAVSGPASRQKYLSGNSQALARTVDLEIVVGALQNYNDSHDTLSMAIEILISSQIGHNFLVDRA